MKKTCIANHGLSRPNEFYGLEAGKDYNADLNSKEEIDGETYIYVERSMGDWIRVNSKRFCAPKPDLDSDEEAQKIGKILARVLKMKKSYGIFEIEGGPKTAIGLARTVKSILDGQWESV